MSVLRDSFAAVRASGRHGVIPFLVAGDPDLATTGRLVRELSALQPVAIEIGVPFSDPSADGPVIQRASGRALRRGTTLANVLEHLKKTRTAARAPLVLFTYYNPLLQLGLANFAGKAARAGVAGVLVVDLPAEAAGALRGHLSRKGLDLILLVAPTTSADRLRQIARTASGFIYAVARTGVTGNTRGHSDESAELVERLRALTSLPVAVGFGIRTRARVGQVCRYADAAVVGSALVETIEKASAGPQKARRR